MVHIKVKKILLAAVGLLFLNNSLAASIPRQANVWEGRCPQKNTTLKPNRYPFDPCRKGFNELFPESEWLLSHALTYLFFQKPPTFNGFYTLAWNWDLLRARLDNPNINTTVLVWTNEIYDYENLVSRYFDEYDRYGYDNFIQSPTVNDFLHAIMFPYPIQENEWVVNEWGYDLSWGNTSDGVVTHPLRYEILKKEVFANGELWFLGKQIPTRGYEHRAFAKKSPGAT